MGVIVKVKVHGITRTFSKIGLNSLEIRQKQAELRKEIIAQTVQEKLRVHHEQPRTKQEEARRSNRALYNRARNSSSYF